MMVSIHQPPASRIRLVALRYDLRYEKEPQHLPIMLEEDFSITWFQIWLAYSLNDLHMEKLKILENHLEHEFGGGIDFHKN